MPSTALDLLQSQPQQPVDQSSPGPKVHPGSSGASGLLHPGEKTSEKPLKQRWGRGRGCEPSPQSALVEAKEDIGSSRQHRAVDSEHTAVMESATPMGCGAHAHTGTAPRPSLRCPSCLSLPKHKGPENSLLCPQSTFWTSIPKASQCGCHLGQSQTPRELRARSQALLGSQAYKRSALWHPATPQNR